MKYDRKTVDELLKEHVPVATAEEVRSVAERVLYRLHHVPNRQPLSGEMSEGIVVEPQVWSRRRLVFATAFAVVLAIGLSIAFGRKPVSPISSDIAIVEFIDGTLNSLRNGQHRTLHVNDRIVMNESVSTDSSLRAGLALSDGSHVEMRSESMLTLEQANDGARIRLLHGSIIVDAAKQRSGHLYVQTRDIAVSVVGTLFVVTTEESRSLVGVIEGEVRVRRGDAEISLFPGEQILSTLFVKESFVPETIAWSRYAAEHITPLSKPVGIPPLPRLQKASFDAISIRPNVSGSANGGIVARGNRLLATNVTAKMLVAYAYQPVDGKLLKAQIIGGKGWTETARFDVQATLENGGRTPIEQMREMVRSLLQNRFQFKARQETRELPVYNLVLVKNGPKLSADQTPPDSKSGYITFASEGENLRQLPRGAIQEIESPFRTTLTGTAIPMSMLVQLLQGRSDRIIIDKTGFNSLFDLDLQFAKDSGALVPGDTATPELAAAVQSVGVRLEPATALLPVVVIDTIEKPSEN